MAVKHFVPMKLLGSPFSVVLWVHCASLEGDNAAYEHPI